MIAFATSLVACAPQHSVKRAPEVVLDQDASGGGSAPNPKGAPEGTRCVRNSECRSGDCVDGVCCESACAGVCVACDKPGSEGQCLPVPDGQDPDNECEESPLSTCGRDGVCDGRGACRRYQVGTECGKGGCKEATETAASTCDGNGQCQRGPSKSCAPAVCIENSCGTPCATDTDCLAGFFCDSATCRTKRDQGAGCAMDAECSSGHCADKVCCATACADKCYACNVLGSVGSCTAVKEGLDPKEDCPVQGIFTCGNAGGCNGRGACRSHLAGTPCSSGTTCSGSTLTGSSACDGMGKCKVGVKSDCSPYVCNGPVCWTVCATNDQCKAPRTCRANHCQ
jgi:hypothetical protein